VEKPSVGYFEYVAAHINGFDPQKALIIGDSLTSDMRGGLNYGIDTCWYNPAKKSCPADMRLTFIANSFDDVIDFITKEENI
jgi:2-haloacid dehalogenase